MSTADRRANYRINRRIRRFERTRKRYARTLVDLWAHRQDAHSLAVHLRDSIPYLTDSGDLRVSASSVHYETGLPWPPAQLAGDAVAELRNAAYLAGAVTFWVDDRESGQSFDVYVVRRDRDHYK